MATGTTVSACIRRRRGSQSDVEPRFALEEMLRTGIVETLLPHRKICSRRFDYANTIPERSVADGNVEYLTNADEGYKRLIAEREDLLSIVVRTIILIRRNRILERRLNALRAETRRFLRSESNNPEDQRRRSQVPSHSEDTWLTGKIVSTTLSPSRRLSDEEFISSHQSR